MEHYTFDLTKIEINGLFQFIIEIEGNLCKIVLRLIYSQMWKFVSKSSSEIELVVQQIQNVCFHNHKYTFNYDCTAVKTILNCLSRVFFA